MFTAPVYKRSVHCRTVDSRRTSAPLSPKRMYALFAIGVSAAETAVAIAIIINIYRNIRNIQVKNLNEMKN